MQKGIKLNERDFFKTPFSRAEIEALLQGRPAADMFSFRSPRFKALGKDPATMKDDDLIRLMLNEPRLIRRPIVKDGKRVSFGADGKLLAEILKS